MSETYDFSELCQALARSRLFVRNLQRALGLYVPPGNGRYSEAYLRFLEQVVALRTFNIPVSDIVNLFAKEQKILRLLHCDALSDSPTWYLDACGGPESAQTRLLLTGYDVGFPLTGRTVQANLDFAARDPELFAGAEMGEDVHRILAMYLQAVDDVRARIEKEKPVLMNALAWSDHVFGRTSAFARWTRAGAVRVARRGSPKQSTRRTPP
ncbi:MAG: hypothetical protein JXR37_05265 [Kiritimatiellae bacterium]|nr:hypothetical protein [Kiritimatiellia bacterium]